MSTGPFEVVELEDEDLEGPITERCPVINLEQYKKDKEYRDFWSDSCWTEPPGPLG